MTMRAGHHEDRRYEPPALTVIGTVGERTLTHEDWRTKCWPYVNKTIGPPDYFTFIPVTSCSA